MGGRFGGFLVEKVVLGVKVNGEIEVQFELKTGQTVIVVAVGEKNKLRFELEAENFFGDEVGFVSRIDDGAFKSLWVVKQIAVGAHLTDSDSFDLHEKIIQGLTAIE